MQNMLYVTHKHPVAAHMVLRALIVFGWYPSSFEGRDAVAHMRLPSTLCFSCSDGRAMDAHSDLRMAAGI